MGILPFLTSDLLFQSRVASAAKAKDLVVVADRSYEKLMARVAEPDQVRLVIVDLTLPTIPIDELFRKLRGHFPLAKFIAYGPHVHEAKLQQAVSAGFDRVLTRGQFDHQIGEWIEQAQSKDGAD